MVRTAALALGVFLGACGGGDPTNPGGGGGGGVTNFTAKIDGADWAPDVPPTAVNAAAGFYSITGFRSTGSNNYTLVFTLANITGPGTYPLGVTPQMFGGAAQLSQPPASGWATPTNGTAGEIVITTLSATRMVATFAFVATPLMGTSVNKTVTQGQFDVPVSGNFGVAAANQGSSFSGTIGGSEGFVGSIGSASLVTSGTPNLVILVNNDLRTLTIGVANMTGAGTYTLGASPARTIQLGGSAANPLAAWTSNTAGGSGSVTITSATSGRIVGSFTATVVGVSGGASGPLTVSGSFSMGGSF
jgi:hypothetical protein